MTPEQITQKKAEFKTLLTDAWKEAQSGSITEAVKEAMKKFNTEKVALPEMIKMAKAQQNGQTTPLGNGLGLKGESKYTKEEAHAIAGSLVKTIVHSKINNIPVRESVVQLFPESPVMIKTVNETSGVAGGLLISDELSGEFLPLLRDRAVVRQIGARVMPMNSNVLRINRMVNGAVATYGKENARILVSNPDFGDLSMTAKKLTVLVPISNDLLRDEGFNTSEIIGDDVFGAFASRGDLAFIRGKGESDDPIGVRFQAGINTFGAGADNVNGAQVSDADLTKAIRLTSVGKKGNVVKAGWLMNSVIWGNLFARIASGLYTYRTEMEKGRLLNAPFLITDQIPSNITKGSNDDTSELYHGDWNEAIIAENEQLILGVSTEGTYVTAGSEVRSAIQNDETIITGIERHDFGLRYPAAFTVMDGCRDI